ncbi:HD domain-containing protein [Pseudoclavibacter helvolus]|uniref:HD domain-containing protein n=1 Tax=Pseudoclavibacter helvolus TaxID=255205 RepID=UPI0024AE0572|nr:HD domain-containing protein [Pseudoclavibacter helvolus]
MGISALEAYRERIEVFTSNILDEYVSGLTSIQVGHIGSKEVNDPVSGTIALNALEVVVLDSPLLQRLRRIRQLGVAQYVYPGANHTRLEHSIGVCHQVQLLVTSLELHADGQALTESWTETLRLAALCHDVGHGVMSHVVENALRFDRFCEDLTLEFQDKTGKDTSSQLSEIAAYYMLRSPAFSDLVVEARRIAGLSSDPEMNQRMADLVIGYSQDESFPLIHEAISGPFDCDKLDYMKRDALMCGVPVVTDVTRLVQKVRAVKVVTDRLPEYLQRIVDSKSTTHTVVAVSRSGASTLHEVSLARSLMHDKVYRHHKVRATETMVAAVIDKVGRTLDSMSAMIPLSIEDEAFLGLDESGLRSLELRTGVTLDSDDRLVVLDLARRLRERQLFVRAFAFSQKMPFDAYRKDRAQRATIEELIRDADDGSQRREIVNQVAEQVRRMLDLVPNGRPIPAVMLGDLAAYIWIDPPVVKRKSEHDSDQNRAYLVDHGDELVLMADVSAETRGWADAYINTRDVGYVFSPEEISTYVHIATEMVLRTQRGIFIPREMRSYAKVSSDLIDKLRSDLQVAGYYDGLPRDLRPLPVFLGRSATSRRLAEAAQRLAQYMGPNPRRDENKVEPGALNARRISDWLAQFDDEYLDMALSLVEQVQILDRASIIAAVSAFVSEEQNSSFKNASLVPLGAPKDGSAVLTYYSGDLQVVYPDMKIRTLGDALARDAPIVFVDDIIQRGSSVISIFESLLGLEDSRQLNEERGETLGVSAIESLKSRPIAIVVSAGISSGVEEVKATLSGHGLDIRVHAQMLDGSLPNVEDALAGFPQATVSGFKNRLREIGLDLVKDGRFPEERAFGYGNQGLLVISAFNTPTMTLTAFWAAGIVDGAAWRPLFPRRSKT